MSHLYSSAEFEDQYTYEGDDLGATWTETATTFRLWAPTATAVTINLYESGHPEAEDDIDHIAMTPDVNGTWIATVEGDLNGVYYTYSVTVDGTTREACDPYARTTGVNGQRAMVIDLRSTDPEGWEDDVDPHYSASIVDAVIYELHVRDLSIDDSSGIQNSYLLTIENLPTYVVGFLSSLTGDAHIILLLVMVLVIFLGMFIDGTAIVVMFAPLLTPMAASFGIDPLHFAMVVVLTVVIGGLTPPVGITFYIVSSVRNTPLNKVVPEVWKFAVAALIVVFVCIFIPDVLLLIPRLFG